MSIGLGISQLKMKNYNYQTHIIHLTYLVHVLLLGWLHVLCRDAGSLQSTCFDKLTHSNGGSTVSDR